MCALDESSSRTYFVKTEAGGEWFQERLLKKESNGIKGKPIAIEMG
jgi:hypothetical protein